MLKKAIRTAQNFFPGLAQAKNDLYHFSRSTLGTVHDREFAAVAALPRRENDLFVDVGANRGQSILAIRRFRPGARIVSFEPNPVIFRDLQRRFGGREGLQLENVGLGPVAEERPLYIPAYRGFQYDGLATFSEAAARSFLSSDTLFFFNPARLTVTTHACSVRTLDSFNLHPTFLKVDVEGFEYEVLEGAGDTLRRARPVLMLERFYPDDRLSPMLAGLGYAEVTLQDGRLRPGRSRGLNMLLVADRDG